MFRSSSKQVDDRHLSNTNHLFRTFIWNFLDYFLQVLIKVSKVFYQNHHSMISKSIVYNIKQKYLPFHFFNLLMKVECIAT